MPSPIGHTLAGVAIYAILHRRQPNGSIQVSWKALLPFLVLPNLPDVDFLASYILSGNPRLWHGEITHTLGFAVLASILLTPFQLFGSSLRTFVIALTLVGSHLLLDMSCGDPISGTKGMGVELFYPFSEEKIHLPLILFFGIHHRTIDALVSMQNVVAIAWELLFFIVLILLIIGPLQKLIPSSQRARTL